MNILEVDLGYTKDCCLSVTGTVEIASHYLKITYGKRQSLISGYNHVKNESGEP